MKRSWIITLLVVLLLLVGTLIVLLLPQTVPFSQCSSIYKKYADAEGIEATFIKDFRVNDTVFIDVTLLEAKDSAGWATLKQDFSLPELDAGLQQIINSGKDPIISIPLSENTLSLSPPNIHAQKSMLAISYKSHTLTIFHITNNTEKQAVLFHNLDRSINK